MSEILFKLTVMYKEPFWIGLLERSENERYEVCKVTFGAEPKDYEVYEFILKNWKRLKFSEPISTKSIVNKKVNPKRMQRSIKKETSVKSMGTFAQQALKLQMEQGKKERIAFSREQREAEIQRKFELRQEKRKEKHRGH